MRNHVKIAAGVAALIVVPSVLFFFVPRKEPVATAPAPLVTSPAPSPIANIVEKPAEEPAVNDSVVIDGPVTPLTKGTIFPGDTRDVLFYVRVGDEVRVMSMPQTAGEAKILFSFPIESSRTQDEIFISISPNKRQIAFVTEDGLSVYNRVDGKTVSLAHKTKENESDDEPAEWTGAGGGTVSAYRFNFPIWTPKGDTILSSISWYVEGCGTASLTYPAGVLSRISDYVCIWKSKGTWLPGTSILRTFTGYGDGSLQYDAETGKFTTFLDEPLTEGGVTPSDAYEIRDNMLMAISPDRKNAKVYEFSDETGEIKDLRMFENGLYALTATHYAEGNVTAEFYLFDPSSKLLQQYGTTTPAAFDVGLIDVVARL